MGYPVTDEPTTFNRDLWNSHIHPLDLPMVNEHLNKHIDQQSDFYNAQYRMFDTKGELIWVHERGKVMNMDSNDAPLYLFGTITDITKKIQYESELERLKNNQETLINGTTDLLWSVDPEFKLIIANAAFMAVIKNQFGYSIKEGDYLFSDKFSTANDEKWITYYKRALKGERFTVKERIHNISNTGPIFGLISFNPIYSKKDKLLGVSCYSKDITSELRSQQITLNAKLKLEKILNASLDIICTVDEEGYFLTINKACKKILGYAPQELIGKNFMDLVYENDEESTKEISKSVMLGTKVKNFENRYLHKEGHLVSLLWSANWDENEGVMYSVAKDVTEKKKIEIQLAQSEQRFKTLIQEGSDLVAILDENANYVYVSPTSTKVLQISPEEFIGTNAFDYMHPEDRESVQHQFRQISEKSQIKIPPFRFKNKDKEWRWIETIVTNQLHEPAINGLVTNSRDVTDRVLHLKAIEEQNRKLKSIAWNQSHVVRAPVARLMGLVGLLQEDGCLKKIEKDKILRYILESAEEIDNVIKQTVDQTVTKKKITDNNDEANTHN